MNLLLSSTGLSSIKHQETFQRCAQGVERKVAIITTAATKYKAANRNNIALKEDLTHLGFKPYFIDVEMEDPKRLSDTSICILGGGNPYFLLYHLRKSGADQIILEKLTTDQLVMGISAGIFILSKDLFIVDALTPEMNTVDIVDKKALGAIDEIIVPHYDRFVKEGRIQEETINLYEGKYNRKVIRLKETELIIYNQNGFEVL